uniref:Peptidase S1 domain-containing protein n=1 Tax=Paramormyrops kingsleyae TaxID=1676925 RepID=A0A3B3RLN6_9TELE
MICPSTEHVSTAPGSSGALYHYIWRLALHLVMLDLAGPAHFGSSCRDPCTEAGSSYVLAAMDYFTKWPDAYAIPDQSTTTIATKLLKTVGVSRSGTEECRLHPHCPHVCLRATGSSGAGVRTTVLQSDHNVPFVKPKPLFSVSVGDQLQSDIVGGHKADQYRWPWMVAIFVKEKNPHNAGDTKANFTCGGTLIHHQWVLTMFQWCLHAKQIRVHVGIYKRDDPRNETKVKYFSQHEAYAHGIQRNDIALLKLSQPVNDVRLVTLSKASDVFSSDIECHVAGWGNTKQDAVNNQGHYLSPQWRIATQPIKFLLVTMFNTFTNSCPLKARFGNSCPVSHDVCIQGDSGGPLMCPTKNKNRPWVQLGIVNQADGCGEKPSIFANATYYRRWIAEKVGVVP